MTAGDPTANESVEMETARDHVRAAVVRSLGPEDAEWFTAALNRVLSKVSWDLMSGLVDAARKDAAIDGTTADRIDLALLKVLPEVNELAARLFVAACRVRTDSLEAAAEDSASGDESVR